MDLNEMIKLWPQYQKWLKDNGITKDNAKDKAIQIVNQIKTDPTKAQAIKDFFNSPELSNLAKSFNFTDSQIEEVRTVINENPSPRIGSGNLTSQQMAMIKQRGYSH